MATGCTRRSLQCLFESIRHASDNGADQEERHRAHG